MPANKRQFEVAAGGEEEHDLQPRDERELKRKRVVDDEDDEDDDDDDYDDGDGDDREDDGDAAHDESDLSSSSTEGATEEEEEFVMINLSEIRKEVQCPICLGIIRKTRTVMECLHRFCRECIDKSMRLGNNECPACRTHCASRRSLRDDPNYDALIAALYPDIDEYEEEELAFNEEDKARNKQIQETIAQTVKIQSEVSGRKRSSKRAAAEIVRKSRLNLRDTPSRGKKNCRNEVQVCDNDDLSEDEKRDSSSADEHCYSEVKPKRSRRSIGARTYSQPSGSIDRGSDENGSDGTREHAGTVGGLVRASERLSWGKGGIRSHTRHGNGSGSSVKNARANRISKLIDHLRNSKENEDEMDMQLMLVPINEQTMPNLQQPHLSCKPSLSVGFLLQYVAVGTESQTEEIELYLVKELQPKLNPSISIDPSKDKLQVLNEEERLAGLRIYNFINGYVLLAYQRKLQADKS